MRGDDERRIRWLWGGIGGGCFLLLLLLEILTEADELDILDIAADALALALTVGAATGVALLVQRMQRQHEEKMTLLADLEVARSEGEAWRQRMEMHLSGIREEMQRQFEVWQMTEAEQEIGLLMLKGLSHKQIAGLRGTSEATVRQQARSIDQKAKLPGKTAFSAYFLEDLIVPEATMRRLPQGVGVK